MTDEQFLNNIEKRLSNGLSILNAGDDKHKEKMTFALEVHRLLPYCSLLSMRYVFKIVYMKLKIAAPNKEIIRSFIQFYQLFEVALGSHKWPEPKIQNNMHDSIRVKLQDSNAKVEAALNGEELTATQKRIVTAAANDEAKAAIKLAAETRKREKAQAKQNAIRIEEEKRALARKEIVQAKQNNPIKKIRNGGYNLLNNNTTDNRQHAEELMEERRSLPYCVSHKIRLMPNNMQKQYLQQCFGVARFSYNWCYDEWMRLRAEGEHPFGSTVTTKFTEIAKKEYPFVYKVTHFAKQTGTKAFETAVNNFFNGSGFPQRKKHGIGCGSLHYVVTGKRKDPILADYNPDVPDSKPSAKRQYLLIPTFGYIKMAEKLRFNGQLTSVCIKLQSDGHYYAVLNVYINKDEWKRTHKGKYNSMMRYGVKIDTPTGIDLGVKDLAILSNGIKICRRPDDEQLHKKKKDLQKRISHQHELHPNHTSKRQKRNKWLLANINAKMRRQRCDYIQKATTAIAYIYSNVSMENLNIVEMLQNGDNRAGKILNSAFYLFRTLMEQKMAMNGHHLHIADKYLPSTRTCSVCGCVGGPVPLSERTFHCKECGAELDRDINAAINLAKLIGLDEPNPSPADKGAITVALQACRVMVHQAGEESR